MLKMSQYSIMIMIAFGFLIYLIAPTHALIHQINGAQNKTFYLDPLNASYDFSDNSFYAENASLTHPNIIFNGADEGIDPPKLTDTNFILGYNNINFTENIFSFELNISYLVNDDYSCNQDTDCDTSFCMADYDVANGKFCAKDSTSCVHKIFGDTATQYNDGGTSGGYECDAGIWKVEDDYPCTLDADCASGDCMADYDVANGKFCAKDSTSCVHKIFGNTATQYNDGDDSGNYECDTGTWKLEDDQPCTLNTECISDYCRSDYKFANGKFCAQDSTSCVHKIFGYTATQFDDGEKYKSQKCNSGSWNFMDTDGDGVGDDVDSCPGTPGGCTIGSGDINATNGCPIDPVSGYHIKAGVISSCPHSSIPVDPEKSSCLEAGIADSLDILFFLETGGIETRINNLSDCNLQTGTDGWHDISDSRNYCEFQIPGSTTPGNYNLMAKYTIDAINYSKIFHGAFSVLAICSVASICSHGGHIQGSNVLTPGTITFNKPFTTDAGVYITCKGANGTISGVSQYISQCSNGAAGSTTNPGLFAWTYASSNLLLTLGYGDNQYQGGTFESRPSHRNNLFTSNMGYRWTSNLGWSRGAAANTVDDFYTFDYCTDYRVYVDYLDNICDSPDYICPNNGVQCNVGSLDTEGFVALTNYTITIIDPAVDITTNSATTNYSVSEPYDSSIKKVHVWSIKNSGIGKLNVSNIAVTCPSGLACTSSPTTDMILDDSGAELNINTQFTLPCEYSVTDYPITLTFNITDKYGLECSPAHTETITTTIVQANVSDNSRAACECYTGKDNLWDDSGAGCCDPGDCWLSGDKAWFCENSKIIKGAELCQQKYICDEVWYWNISTWSERLPDGCGCESSEDCENGQCIAGMCLALVNPNLSFSSTSFTAELGSKHQAVISIKNNIMVEDTIRLRLYGTPEKILFWTKFENNEKVIDISLNAYEEKLIPIEIFAGEIGTYKLTIFAESTLSSTLYTRDEQAIHIVQKDQDLTSRTPGLNAVSILIILLIIASICTLHKMND